MKKKIILDVDPGYDDAFAILLAGKHKSIDLQGITVVAGNQSLERTLKNTLDICSNFNIDTKIAAGMSGPLLREKIISKNNNCDLGIRRDLTKEDIIKIENIHGVNHIINTLHNSKEKMTIVGTGPLTNIAMAVKLYPEITKKIEKLVIMGGSIGRGNITPKAEFNIFADPESAHILFNSEIDIVMIGLHVTEKIIITEEVFKKIKSIDTNLSRKLYNMMIYDRENSGIENRKLHDPATIAYLIHKDIFQMEKMNMEIILEKGNRYGQTKVYKEIDKDQKQINVAMDINVEEFWNILYKLLRLEN